MVSTKRWLDEAGARPLRAFYRWVGSLDGSIRRNGEPTSQQVSSVSALPSIAFGNIPECKRRIDVNARIRKDDPI